jgi:tetratricopeptide (TPR) repeat protein
MPQPIATQLDSAQRHFDAGRLDAAAQILLEVIAADPAHGDALEGLACIAARQQNAALAAEYFDRALAVLPATAERCHTVGLVNQAAGNHRRAVELLEQGIALAPRQLALLHAAAISLSALGEHERALDRLRQAAALNPGAWEIRYNIGRALGLLGRYEAEIAEYRRVIEMKPDCVDAYVNLGVALRDLHCFDEAMRMYKKAVQLDPSNVGARTNRAQTNLLLGQFEHGWREYEWRWRDGVQRHAFGERIWLGETPLAGKSLLIHNEQGFGDTLQFVRYVRLLEGTGATIILRVQDALRALLADTPGASQVIGESDAVPAFDYHCPLLSLPHALRAMTASIPAETPYLAADPALRAQWRSWLAKPAESGGPARRPRIGVAWSGSTWHLNDRNRSTRLQDWAAVLDSDVSFISLQKDIRDSDLDAMTHFGALRNPAAQLRSFSDTAALIAELDLVISVDTAVAHLAGALGKPVWILLPFTPDWRWQLQREDSPWYSNARLFRQTTRGQWQPVMMAVGAAVQAFSAAFDTR